MKHVLRFVFFVFVGFFALDGLAQRPKLNKSDSVANFSIDTLQDLVNFYAPIVRLHKKERYKMCNVDWYFEQVTKEKFLHYNSRGELQFYKLLDQVNDNNILEHQTYGKFSRHKVLKPRKGIRVSSGNQKEAISYVHVIGNPKENEILIQYWYFYAFNGTAAHHEGDWEYYMVQLDTAGQAVAHYLSQHSKGEKHKRLRNIDDRSMIYSANKSHAMYKRTGGFHMPFFMSRDRTNNGEVFETWNNLEIVAVDGIEDHDVEVIPRNWLEYNGRWGAYGSDLGGWGGPVGPKTNESTWNGDKAKTFK